MSISTFDTSEAQGTKISSSSSSFSYITPPPVHEGSVGNSQEESKMNSETTIPLLPPVDPNEKSIPSIKLGETIRFDEMGPVIINSDGTTRRISNWDKLTKREQEVTWRRISKRNEERRKMLLEQLGQQLPTPSDEL